MDSYEMVYRLQSAGWQILLSHLCPTCKSAIPNNFRIALRHIFASSLEGGLFRLVLNMMQRVIGPSGPMDSWGFLGASGPIDSYLFLWISMYSYFYGLL